MLLLQYDLVTPHREVGSVSLPPLRLGTSLCLSSSGVDVMLCDFQDKARKGEIASSWLFFLRHLLLELELGAETACYEDTWVTCTSLV